MVYLEIIKTIFDITQSIFTIGAIIAAGYWFFRRRQRYPRAQLSYSITDHKMNADWVLVSVRIVLTNVGSVLIRMKSSLVQISQMLPLIDTPGEKIEKGQDPVEKDRSECNWRCIGRRKLTHNVEIEPQESESFQYDFLVAQGGRTHWCICVF